MLVEFRKEVSNNPNFFKNLPENLKSEIKNGQMIKRPTKGFLGRLTDALTDPITGSVNLVKKKFSTPEKLALMNKQIKLENDMATLEGLVEYVEGLKEKDPEKVKKLILEKIKKNFTKVKANYSSNLFTTMIDFAALAVSTVYHGCDFYNITRKANDNHKEAIKEAKIKVKQDTIRFLIMAYLTYVVTTLFKKGCNKSMPRMIGILSLIEITADIINRKATGRPVLPMSTKSYKEYKKKEQEKKLKKGIATPDKIATTEKPQKDKPALKPSFTGSGLDKILYKEIAYSKNELKKILDLTEKIDTERAKRYISTIEERFADGLKGKKLSELYSDNNLDKIIIGKTDSLTKRIANGIFIPITATVKLAKRLMAKEKAAVDDFIEIKNYLAYANKLIKGKYKDKDLMNDKDALKDFRNDIMQAAFASFRSLEANYNSANFAIIKKISGYAIFTFFYASDAYNVTLLHTDGDKEKGLMNAKQRALQEVTRFCISMYTVSSSLAVLGNLYNKTIANAVAITTATSSFSNYLTRSVLGLPILPKNKKQLDALDEKNKKSSFHRFTNKLIGKKSEQK